ncbi:MAG TPA: enoyl-CoA hydratase/isomerase family protein [Acidimicrobiales bacterium]|nr:enoyl-CoA hydratase/isomerase family protein [Acidimicrobiales bacterium]
MIGIERQGHVLVVELQRPPHNYFSLAMVEAVADAFDEGAGDTDLRCGLLVAQGRSFCAGADFSGAGDSDLDGLDSTERLYASAARLCAVELPWVAAVHGAAIGGGLGLALAANLRVTCPAARFSANFGRLGIHQGFGISVTLPELVGPSTASLVLLTGRRFHGDEATRLGLADLCVDDVDDVRPAALALAAEIAEGAPLATRAINRTLRAGLADRVRQATRLEAGEQARLARTADAAEGIASVLERRPGSFTGR